MEDSKSSPQIWSCGWHGVPRFVYRRFQFFGTEPFSLDTTSAVPKGIYNPFIQASITFWKQGGTCRAPALPWAYLEELGKLQRLTLACSQVIITWKTGGLLTLKTLTGPTGDEFHFWWRDVKGYLNMLHTCVGVSFGRCSNLQTPSWNHQILLLRNHQSAHPDLDEHHL